MKGERMEFNPDRMVGHKIRMVHNSIDKFFDRHHKEKTKKIPRGQVMIIHYLMDHPDEEVYQKDLEKFFSISGATATNMIKGLEKSELVERIPNEKDARLKRIVLTEKAVVREQRIRKLVMELEEGMIVGFTEEEISTYCKMTDRILQNLDELNRKICSKKDTK